MIEALRRATPEDIHHVCRHMRDDDRMEWYFASGRAPEEILHDKFPAMAMVIPATGEVVGLCGVTPLDHRRLHGPRFPRAYGNIWMCGTDVLEDHSITLVRYARKWVEELSLSYYCLGNVVWAGNKTHVRWLRFMGFKFDSTPLRVNDQEFLSFRMDL